MMYKEKILLPGDFSQQRELENRCSFHGFLHLDYPFPSDCWALLSIFKMVA